MKRIFHCFKCGNEFEIEANYFEPGISGTTVTSDGIVSTFVDPTDDHLCPICRDVYVKELLTKFMEW